MQVIAASALVLAVIAVAVAAFAIVRLRQVQRHFRVLWGADASRQGDVASVLAAQEERAARAAAELDRAREEMRQVRSEAASSLRHVAVVRYDAFGDMAGRLSFSAALVDDAGDGLVLSSIHARGESRTYAKGIEAGRSSRELTPEEQQAVAAARAGGETT